MKKASLRKVIAATILGSCLMAGDVFAGEWKADSNGWWYQNDDGSYPTDSWQWLDGNKDGVAECYYFDGRGYCMTSAITPDGYQVDQDGAWVVGGVVQSRTVSVPQQAGISESTARKLCWIADVIYHGTESCGSGIPVDMSASSLSSADKSYVFYRYQYRYCGEDPRITKAPGTRYAPENKVLASDLRTIAKELFGTATDKDIQTISGNMRKQGAYYYIEAFEPEAADPFYLSEDGLSVSMENGQVRLSGQVGRLYENVPAAAHFTAYFVPNPGAFLDGYRFDRLILQ